MNFIICAAILNPPTSLECFRQLSFWIDFNYKNKIENILIETPRLEIDNYFRYLKRYPGGLDYVNDWIYEDELETGLRLDDSYRLAPTIQAAYINENNIFNILRAISYN